MTNALISVIVPVYNVERYLPRCIESILGQTHTNFELILVDDGTPDRSGIICDRYAEKDSRIRVIHKENGGVSTARNAGIDAAKGEWITFVDSDDWVNEKYLESFISCAFEHKVDVVVGTIQWKLMRTASNPLDTKMIEIGVTPEEYITNIVVCQEFLGPVAKLFNTKIIQDNQIRFPVEIPIGEDTVFTNRYLKHCRKIYTTSQERYFYNKFNTNSITKNYVAGAHFVQWMDTYFKSYTDMWDAYGMSDKCKNASLHKIAYSAYVFHVKGYIKQSCEYSRDGLLKINEIFKYWLLLDVASHTSNTARELVKAIACDDVDKICALLNTKGTFKQRIRSCIRKYAMKISRPFIERYRDGLIKFKF